MNAIALKPIRVKSTGHEYLPGDSITGEPLKLLQWCERGLVRIVEEALPCPDPSPGRPDLPGASETGEKRPIPPRWDGRKPRKVSFRYEDGEHIVSVGEEELRLNRLETILLIRGGRQYIRHAENHFRDAMAAADRRDLGLEAK